jgi:NAD(P)-dependent dehydrogenase (short-subunit alcohol dehydrogenase family)
MAGRVEGGNVVITGAGSGMGRAFTVGLAPEGYLTGHALGIDGGMAPV